MPHSLPLMSVVILTPDNYATIRRTIKHLRAQSVRDRLELVLVAPGARPLGLEEAELKDFQRVRVVEYDPRKSSAVARAKGIYQATAPVVALAEDHSFPALGWAEALLKAHLKPWAAVGPVVANANPVTLTSCANFLIEYEHYMEPAAAGVVDHLPGHNSSYKRDLLLSYGQRLASFLEAEIFLHQDLRRQGYQLYLEPGAKVYHLNYSRPFSWVKTQFYAGRQFAAARVQNEGWGSFTQMCYCAGAPLIPLVRLRRILRKIRLAGGLNHSLAKLLPVLALVLLVSGAGEMLGYAWGSGAAGRRISELEGNRIRFLAKDDLRALADIDQNLPAPPG